jgi:hypothetical protein
MLEGAHGSRCRLRALSAHPSANAMSSLPTGCCSISAEARCDSDRFEASDSRTG